MNQDPDCSEPGLTRPHYFAGQMLTADDFQDEQEYHSAALRRLTRVLVGFGVVSGLDLTVSGNTVVVTPGIAVDNAGHLLERTQPCELDLPPGECFVFLGYAEEERNPVPALGDAEEAISSRIQELGRVFLRSAREVGKAWKDGRWADVKSLDAVPLGHVSESVVHLESRVRARRGSRE
jgi:hypothetical protein